MSRNPPLPAGLPPRPPNHVGADTWRPSQQPDRRDDWAPQPSAGMYQFRGAAAPRDSRDVRDNRDYDRDDRQFRARGNDYYSAPSGPPPAPPGANTYRPSYNNDRYDRPDRDFDFRRDAPPGIDRDRYRQNEYRARSPPPPRHNGYVPDNSRDNSRAYRQNNHSGGARGGRGGYRGRGGPRLAADREFLKTNRAPTPELMEGMQDGAAPAVTYKPVEDLSDSDEAPMDLEDDEKDNETSEQPRKKQKLAGGDGAPRWSNPDPYTVLPPPEDTRKGKDMVKMIRKSRVISSTESTKKTEVVADDFISFDDNDNSSFLPHKPKSPEPRLPAANQSRYDLRNGAPQQIPNQPANNGRAINIPKAPSQQLASKTGKMAQSATSVQPARPQNGVASHAAPNNKSAIIDLTSDPALGSRKRNFRDELKPPPNIHDAGPGKKNMKAPSSGNIKSKWQAKPGIPETPWVTNDHSNSTNMGLWLHKEIMDWYHFVKARPFEQFIREKLVEDLRDKVQQGLRYPADVHPFGSFPAGLYLPTSDMDLVCLSEAYMQDGHAILASKTQLWKFNNFVHDARLAMPNTTECIVGAKVPLVKYVDGTTGLKVDISFENNTGLIANKTFQEWKTQFPAMPILVTLIKHLLAMRGLNEPVNGGIGGFSVTCLVVSLLQHMPQVQSRTMIPEHHLGEILMEFLDLYGNQFNTETTAIVLNPPGYVSKAQVLRGGSAYKGNNVQNKFCIMDPNREDNDISGGSSNTPTIRRAFSDCYDRLQQRMAELAYSAERQNQSILGVIIGGDYSSFKQQRDHLAHIHETLFGPVEKYD